eukprot:CAMPEP_0175595570 /NCGR_PEP_ID=MMETSP0096-20121207/55040_1 /TAXON_ID=311494 /ORGANISM="Alexandrium monilatum, Strain CCMP3105" /LENGTH=96 /DNA_ID=CAMNT_0016899917 /DNA_START=9 /DNA_END=296 /DNA_ORIENTATION=+
MAAPAGGLRAVLTMVRLLGCIELGARGCPLCAARPSTRHLPAPDPPQERGDDKVGQQRVDGAAHHDRSQEAGLAGEALQTPRTARSGRLAGDLEVE